VPSLRRRHPADRVQSAFRVRNHPWPSHSWQPPVAADFLSASPGRSGRFSPTWVNHSHRRRCRLLVARPPTHAELVQMHDDREALQGRIDFSAHDRYPQPLNPAGREVSTQPPRGPTRRDSAHKPENRHFGGGRQADWEAPSAGRDTGAPDSRAAHPLDNGCGRAIGRAIPRGRPASRLQKRRLADPLERAIEFTAGHDRGRSAGARARQSIRHLEGLSAAGRDRGHGAKVDP